MPLDAAVSLLLPDAGLVVLGREQDPGPEPVALDVALNPHEVLDTVGGGPGQDIVSAYCLLYYNSSEKCASFKLKNIDVRKLL